MAAASVCSWRKNGYRRCIYQGSRGRSEHGCERRMDVIMFLFPVSRGGLDGCWLWVRFRDGRVYVLFFLKLSESLHILQSRSRWDYVYSSRNPKASQIYPRNISNATARWLPTIISPIKLSIHDPTYSIYHTKRGKGRCVALRGRSMDVFHAVRPIKPNHC